MNRWSRSFVGALLALVAVLASACGGDKPVDAVQVLAAAPDKTVAATSARIAGEMTMEIGAQSTHAKYDGALDLKGHGGTMTMDASSFGLPGGEVEVRVVDGVVYVNLDVILKMAGGGLVPPALDGKHWMSLDMSKVVEGAQAMQSDPSAASTNSLEYLRGADPDGIDKIGDEDVRGEPTTHYRADIDVDVMKRKLGDAKMSGSARKLMEQGIDSMDGKTFTMDVWVDHDGRVRRQDFDQRYHVQGRAMRMSMRVEYYDFGVKVDAEKPAADEVVTLADLMALGS